MAKVLLINGSPVYYGSPNGTMLAFAEFLCELEK